LTRPANTARLGRIQCDSECFRGSQITTDFESDPGETRSGQGCAPCNAGCGIWTSYRANLFCLRWQGFLLGSGPETEACGTREARTAFVQGQGSPPFLPRLRSRDAAAQARDLS